ncbi:coproporphyrinogen III oxidase family protein [Dactylosporangium roseum]|uniref:Heme chaperone HemW n=1 Tax=Dactylosporangium roseum TaxID=47989 RepID=A0ABY5ZF81_9ACTN|nr:coproporphyrinogen-III oxidase family protein [Dactylosporangium roseum]UWZ39318.1 coproporphyrinogen III oxidase family protein [Dactylosporangium roseum]
MKIGYDRASASGHSRSDAVDQQTRPSTNIHAYPVQFEAVEPRAFFADPPGALYAHVPFCTKKCHFCNFAITTVHDGDLRSSYVRAMVSEIRRSPEALPVPRSTFGALNIGGGTPALLEGEQLAEIVEAMRSTLPVAPDAEVGVEFDPATVTPGKTRQLLDAGFTRFSVGVQSFEDQVLASANRDHDAAQAQAALDILVGETRGRRVFVNVDLIYPLPGLTGEQWLAGVQRACDMGIDGITLYGLEIWPKTVFHRWSSRSELDLPDRRDELKFHLEALQILWSAGYRPGAASAWIAPSADRYCSYLDVVWSGDPVLGFGVSSRSTVDRRSWNNMRSIPKYVEAIDAGLSPIETGCVRNAAQSMRQHIIRGFKRGYVDPAAFARDFGVTVTEAFPQQLARILDAGLVVEEGGRLELTDLGRVMVANIVHVFVEADDHDARGRHQIGVSFEPYPAAGRIFEEEA